MPGWAPPAFAAGAAATGAGAAPLWPAVVPSDVPEPPASETVGPGASTAAGAPSLVPVGAACPGDDVPALDVSPDAPLDGPAVPALASPEEPDDVDVCDGLVGGAVAPCLEAEPEDAGEALLVDVPPAPDGMSPAALTGWALNMGPANAWV